MLITYYNKIKEGVGAQYQRIICLLAIAKRHNIKYIHIPIIIDHNYNNDPEWNEKWDKMFNINKLSNNDEIDIKEVKYTEKFRLDLDLDKDDNSILYQFTYPFKVFDSNPDYYLNSIKNDIIRVYDENNSNRILIYNKSKISIAIHIRVFNKNDVVEYFNDYINNKTCRFYMTCDMYISYISKLKKEYLNSDIHIFSQKDTFDIHYKQLYDIENITLHLDDLDTFDTFNHLCKADILVMGLSSFSVLAAFYNKNTVIYLPFGNTVRLKSWEIYNP